MKLDKFVMTPHRILTSHSGRKRKLLALFHILQGIENAVDDFCLQGLLLLIIGQTIATPYFAIIDVSVLDRASVWFPVVQLQYSRRFEIQNLVER